MSVRSVQSLKDLLGSSEVTWCLKTQDANKAKLDLVFCLGENLSSKGNHLILTGEGFIRVEVSPIVAKHEHVLGYVHQKLFAVKCDFRDLEGQNRNKDFMKTRNCDVELYIFNINLLQIKVHPHKVSFSNISNKTFVCFWKSCFWPDV